MEPNPTKLVQSSGKPPNAGKGRKPGSQNKLGVAAKDAIAMAADKLGGTDRLVTWAQEDEKNESAFWTTIYPKLLPLQINGSLTVSQKAAAWLGQ